MLKYLPLGLAVVILLGAQSCSVESEAPSMRKTLGGTPVVLESTRVVPTLETNIESGSNAIWCSSFLAAWKAISEDLAEADVALEGSPEVASLLNAAEDPRTHVPKGAMYVATGFYDEGVIEKIEKDLKLAFPDKPKPEFPDIRYDSFVAYAYLESSIKFPIPYRQNDEPLEFTDSRGHKTEVASFGIRPKDEFGCLKLRKQSRILFGRWEKEEESNCEFAVDLCASSSPSQIVVACIERETSLRAALDRIDKEEDAYRQKREGISDSEGIGIGAVLLVPDFFWYMTQHFSELEGRSFLNPKMKGQRFDVARQDIFFRLDRSGVALKSEARMYAMGGGGGHFVFDRPFLVFMRKRGASEPYFAMWIDNAQLLTSWKK